MRIALTLALLSAVTAARAATPPTIDMDALAPIFAQSWTTGESCETGLLDFVAESDGELFSRDAGGFTPLTQMILASGELTVVDEVGVGRSTSIYKLGVDKSLRLWSQIFDPSMGAAMPAAGEDPPMQRVKDGLIVIDDEGKPVSPGTPTPALKPCPARTAFYTPEIVAALDGAWATGDGKGGICPVGAVSVVFDLDRPIPRIRWGAYGDESVSGAYVLAIRQEGVAYVVTEGNAFEAEEHTYTPDGAGGLVQTGAYQEAPLALQRCP